MQLVVCLVCVDEPFVCPETYRSTYMRKHLVMAHRFGQSPLMQQSRGEKTFYSLGRGRHAAPVLEQIEVIL